MNCTRCAAEVASEAAFCSTCGIPWPTAAADPSTHAPLPPQYGPYRSVPPVSSAAGTNGLSIASLVLGILWIGGIGSILALIFGYTGLRQIRQRNESGRGMAIAGIVLGWVGVSGLMLLITLAVIGADSNPSGNGTPPTPAATAPSSHAGPDYQIQFANIIRPLNKESDPQNSSGVSETQLVNTMQTMIQQLRADQWPANARRDINQLVADLQSYMNEFESGNMNDGGAAGTTTATDEQEITNDLEVP